MRAARIFLGFFLIALLGVVCVSLMIETVPVAAYGVRQRSIGGSGVAEQDFNTGFHLGIAGVHKWYFIDKRTHFLTFSQTGDRESGKNQGPLSVRTKDNNTVDFDVTVTYRIVPGSAHQLVMSGNHLRYPNLIATGVENVLREELAQLSSEDIYSTALRMGVAQVALAPLKAEMSKYFCEPEAVFVRAIRFTPEYEHQLQAKQLTYQKKLLAEARKLVEDEKAITETISAEIVASEQELRGDWDKRLQEKSSQNKVDIETEIAEANVYDRGTRSEASADYEELLADGKLAVEKAEALRNELRNKALDTTGGRIFLAQQAADNLQIDHVTLNSNDPKVPSILDITEMVKLLIGSED
jgi:regulator of protease activity HflC (stomatin/prohibitin superfamily)